MKYSVFVFLNRKLIGEYDKMHGSWWGFYLISDINMKAKYSFIDSYFKIILAKVK